MFYDNKSFVGAERWVIIMAKHLNLSDRIALQTGLKERKSLYEIAKEMGRDKSTIGREVQSKRQYVNFKDSPSIQARNACVNRYKCNIKENCKSPTCFKRTQNCRLCGECIKYCNSFEEEKCSKYEKSPYVCNGCEKKPRCTLSKWLYDAKKAQGKYEHTLSVSRVGICLSVEELSNLNNIVSPLLKNGQSIHNICQNNNDCIMLSEKSIYKYVHKNLLSASKFDLSRTVQRKILKKSGPPIMIDKKCRKERTYDDFVIYLEKHPDSSVVEMDTVEGTRGGKVILTLYFENCGLQLGFLRASNDSASVTDIFNHIKNVLGPKTFKTLFPIILTDRGSEFSNPLAIESDIRTGEKLSNVFFCDHEFIQYVLKKGNLSRISHKRTFLL